MKLKRRYITTSVYLFGEIISIYSYLNKYNNKPCNRTLWKAANDYFQNDSLQLLLAIMWRRNSGPLLNAIAPVAVFCRNQQIYFTYIYKLFQKIKIYNSKIEKTIITIIRCSRVFFGQRFIYPSTRHRFRKHIHLILIEGNIVNTIYFVESFNCCILKIFEAVLISIALAQLISMV